MEKLVLVGGLLIVWGVIAPWHAARNNGSGSMIEDIRRNSVTASQRARQRAKRVKQQRQKRASHTTERGAATGQQSAGGLINGRRIVRYDWSRLPSRTDIRVPDADRDRIMDLEQATRVPSWAIYGIWTNESANNQRGWREVRPWVPGRSIIARGSKCRRHRGNRCHDAWDGLRSVCAQRRQNGQPVCNPNDVWTSWTGAMGGYQHMPRPFLINRHGNWQAWVTDFNADGVYDPHDPEDSMATTAVYLQMQTQRCGSLRCAVQSYAGRTPHDHYARLVQRYRARWCGAPGYCN